MNYIYGLFCPIAKAIRYIGKSVSPEDRFLAHLTVAKTGRGKHHTARWLRKLLAVGLLPELRILEEIPEGISWKAAERRWIAEAHAKGWPLTNTTDGGDAFPELSKETRAVMSPKIAIGVRKAWADPERRKQWMAAINTPKAKKRHADAMREVRCRPGMREAHIASCKAAWSTLQAKEKARIRALNMWANNEQRERVTTSIRASCERPEVKARLAKIMAEVWQRPEVKAKMSAAMKVAWENPDYRAKLWKPEIRAKQAKRVSDYWAANRPLQLKRMNAPARVAKISAAMTRRNADPAFRAIVDAPDVRARQAATLKATWARRKAEMEQQR